MDEHVPTLVNRAVITEATSIDWEAVTLVEDSGRATTRSTQSSGPCGLDEQAAFRSVPADRGRRSQRNWLCAPLCTTNRQNSRDLRRFIARLPILKASVQTFRAVIKVVDGRRKYALGRAGGPARGA